MVNWSNYFPSLAVLLGLALTACQQQPPLYKKPIPDARRPELSRQLLNGCRFHYQGTVGETLLLQEALRYGPEEAAPYRELGAPAVKRGLAKDFYRHYAKAVAYDPVEWQGWRGYLYLYFYRDYERALIDFQTLDTLTPGFVDYPQSTSILFMSGICYLQMEQYGQAIDYFDRHIAEELKTVEEAYISTETFLFKGIAESRQLGWEAAKATFERGLRNADSKSADLWYWLSKAELQLGQRTAAKEAADSAQLQFERGYYHDRPYVEEFYQTYQAQLEEWAAQF